MLMDFAVLLKFGWVFVPSLDRSQPFAVAFPTDFDHATLETKAFERQHARGVRLLPHKADVQRA